MKYDESELELYKHVWVCVTVIALGLIAGCIVNQNQLQKQELEK